jgi:hypothetical protein
MKKYIFIIIFLVSVFGQLSAQLNFVAGYMGGFPKSESYNNILSNYNLGQDSLLQGFEPLEVLNGITFGANYRFGFVSLQGLWVERFRTAEAEIVNLSNNTTQTSTLNTTFRTFSLGLEAKATQLVVGGSLNFDVFKQKLEEKNTQQVTVVAENGWSSRLYVGTFFRLSRTFSVSIQPFIWIPLSKFDISGLEKSLNDVENSSAKENFKHFGVSFFMYNGRQPN